MFEDANQFILNFGTLAKVQTGNKDIAHRMRNKDYACKQFGNTQLATRDRKFVVSDAQQQEVLEWYHKMLHHPGSQRMYNTIGKYFM